MQTDPAVVLARHVRRAEYADLPEEAVAASKRDILDTLGAMLGGSAAPGINEIARLALRWGGAEESTLLALGNMVPAPQAALVNATMGHALDFDDTLDRAGSIHPGVSVLAASAAVSEAVGGKSGKDFLLALTLGLDVSCRLALAAKVDRGWHRTATYGVFGATAACGKLLGLTEDQLVHSLGIAYSQAAGNRQCIMDGALTKRFQAGQAASSAVLSAFLAQEGFTGAREVFAGRYGFYPMYQPEGYDPAEIEDGLGSVFRGVELSFKPYPCVRGAHALVDAALGIYRDLALEHAGEGAGISRVTVTTNLATYQDQFAPESAKRRPTQVVEAQFSLPFLTATALARGRVGIREVAGVDHARTLELCRKIQGEVVENVPNGWARIEVQLSDGRRQAVETDAPSGSPSRPLSDAALEAKFRDCAANAAVPAARELVDRGIRLLRSLEDESDVAPIFRMFSQK